MSEWVGRMFMMVDAPEDAAPWLVLPGSTMDGWLRCQNMVTHEIEIHHPAHLGQEMVVQELGDEQFLVRKGSRLFRVDPETMEVR